MIEKLDEVTMEMTPLTKELLKNYVLATYEANADVSDDSLKKELLMLAKNNQLDKLVIAEALTNYLQ